MNELLDLTTTENDMSELTLSEYCDTTNLSSLCIEWRKSLERRRAKAQPAKLKDHDWVASDRWPKSTALPSTLTPATTVQPGIN